MAVRLPPTVRFAVDSLIAAVARLVSRIWFKSIETRRLERITDDRPIIVAANHSNGFVDPLLVLATSPRALRFVAKSTLWKLKPVGLLLDLAGVVPVYRRRDGSDTSGNVNVFRAIDNTLVHDGAIGIFPEGRLNDITRLHELKTGTARMALGAHQAGAQSLRIVPVGLLYVDKARPRTRVLVRAGEPIDLDAVLPTLAPEGDWSPDNPDLVHALTDLIAAHLGAAYLDYADADEARDIFAAAAVRLLDAQADPTQHLSLDEVETLTRRIDRAPAAERAAVREALTAFREHLDVLGLEDTDVLPGNTLTRLLRRQQAATTKAVLLAVPAATGAVVNAVPFGAISLLGRRKMSRVSRANNLMLASLIAFPVAWGTFSFWLRRRGWKHPLRGAVVGGPLCGWAAVAFWEQLTALRKADVQWRKLQASHDVMADLEAQRQTVIDAVDAALAAKAGDASPAAEAGDAAA